jgi:predicted AlkP superfamily phosphohydrolase/phosphomutase
MASSDRPRAPLRGALAGALALSPLGLWIVFRLLPFNALGVDSKLLIGLLFPLVFAVVGAAAGLVCAFVGTRLPLGDSRGYATAAIPLLALAGGWFALGRVQIGLPTRLTALVAMTLVAVIALAAGRFLLRGRGRGFARFVAGAEVVALAVLLATGGGSRATVAEAQPDVVQLEPQPPVIVFALDGVEWSILQPLLDAGQLPHLQSIADGGAVSPLQSMEPTWSPPLWTTMWTGKLPEDHGITFFLVDGVYRLPLTGERVIVPRLLGAQRIAGACMPTVETPVTSRQRRATAVWEALGLAGLRSVLANRLVSWPALPLEGVELTNYLVHDDASIGDLTYPPELTAEALRRVEAAPPSRDPALAPVPWLARGLAAEGALWSMAAELAAVQNAELLIVYTHLIDSAHHRYLKYLWPERFAFEVDPEDVARFRDVIPAAYRGVDAMIGAVLDTMPPTSRVLVISDHGVAPNHELRTDVPEPVGQMVMQKAETSDVSGVHGHAPDGIFLLAGPGVRPGPLPVRPHVLDVAPLILNLAGLPAAEDMEHTSPLARDPGLVTGLDLTDPIATYEGWLRREGGTADDALDERVLQELRALGYID